MHPNIIIGNVIIPSWHVLLFAGAIISTALAIYAKPQNFPLSRKEFLFLAILLIISSLFGARLLFVILHPGSRGGFAYFGALVFSILVFSAYSLFRKISFFSLADYCMPFLLLSQVFVRLGCLCAGCCYGKPTARSFGVVFKTVDELSRHPTQAYEALVLVLVYVIGRFIYKAKAGKTGFTFSTTIALYGSGRFFVEFFRVDSPTVFLNLTLAQAACLLLAFIGLAGLTFVRNNKFDKKSN